MQIRDQLKLALRKIARSTGEDEYEPIYQLNQLGINISDESIESLNDHHFLYFSLKIPRTYPELLTYLREKRYRMGFSKNPIEGMYNKNASYVTIPCAISFSYIWEDMNVLLEYSHGIDVEQFDEHEWDIIRELDDWKKAEIQIGRELIANQIKDFFNGHSNNPFDLDTAVIT